MNKLLPVSVILVALCISSCSKSYTCTCTLYGSAGTANITNENIPGATHSKANAGCIAWQASETQLINNAGGTGYVECSI